MVEYRDLKIFTKSTRDYKLTLFKDNATANITDWKIFFVVKLNMEDTDENAKISKTITSHLDAVNGDTLIELSSSDTDLSGVHWYEISYLDDEGNQAPIFFGKINFKKPVLQTRS